MRFLMQVYVPAVVEDVGREEVVLRRLDGGTVNVPHEQGPKSKAPKVLPRSHEEDELDTGVENMDALIHLHEASILANIRRRFLRDLIYTATGPILIAMNPFKWLSLYGDEVVGLYRSAEEVSSTSPHCFAVAEAALRDVSFSEGRESASVIICGESGAGKTETTKLMLSYLSRVATPGGGDGVARRIMGSNPVMEAFGNAKTLRNNNSSRFGKFVRVSFGELGDSPRIAGATITNYLLEKSRVSARGEGERSYHVFYQLVAGASDAEKERWGIAERDAGSFRYLKDGPVDVEGMDDAEDWKEMREAIAALGMGGRVVDELLGATAAVLSLGDVMFDTDPDAGHAGGCRSKNPEAMERTAKLLGLSLPVLESALTAREVRTPDGAISKPLDVAEASDARDALAKSLYARLFDRLIAMVNHGLAASEDVKTTKDLELAVRKLRSLPFVGILDIYGFENMNENGFEQLFINYANEKLQHLFNHTVFEAEARVYRAEGLEVARVDFPDNGPCLELIEARTPPGLLPMIDSECLLGQRASDASLARKLVRMHGEHAHFEAAGPSTPWRGSDQSFVVRHYAGPIKYECVSFVAKNRDTLFASLEEALTASSSAFVAALFEPKPAAPDAESKGGRTPGGGLQQTVAARFREDMRALHTTVSRTSLRFVRCIKPTPRNVSGVFDAPTVAAQLTYAGVMAALEMRRAGFPSRLAHIDVPRRFPELCPLWSRRLAFQQNRAEKGTALEPDDARKLVDAVMSHWASKRQGIEPDMARVGRTLVFLRANVVPALASAAVLVRSAAVCHIQALARGRRDRLLVQVLRRGIVRLQAVARARITRSIFGLRIEALSGARTARLLDRQAADLAAKSASLAASAERQNVSAREPVLDAGVEAARAAANAQTTISDLSTSCLVLPLFPSNDARAPLTPSLAARVRDALPAQRKALDLARQSIQDAIQANEALATAIAQEVKLLELERTAGARARAVVETALSRATNALRSLPRSVLDPEAAKDALDALTRPLASWTDTQTPEPKDAIHTIRNAAVQLAALAAGDTDASHTDIPDELRPDAFDPHNDHAILEDPPPDEVEEEVEEAEAEASLREAASVAGDVEADGALARALERSEVIAPLGGIPAAVSGPGVVSAAEGLRTACEVAWRVTGGSAWREFGGVAEEAARQVAAFETVLEAARAFAEAGADAVRVAENAVRKAGEAVEACVGASDLSAPGPGRVADDGAVKRSRQAAETAVRSAQVFLDRARQAADRPARVRSARCATAMARRARIRALALVASARTERRRRVAAEKARVKALAEVENTAKDFDDVVSQMQRLLTLDPSAPPPPPVSRRALATVFGPDHELTEAASDLSRALFRLHPSAAFFPAQDVSSDVSRMSYSSHSPRMSSSRKMSSVDVRRESLVYRPAARAKAFATAAADARHALVRARDRLARETSAWKTDAKRRAKAVEMTQSAEALVREADEAAVTSGVGARAAVARAIAHARATVAQATRCVTSWDRGAALDTAERRATEAMRTAQEAMELVETEAEAEAARTAKKAAARETLRPILERVARLDAVLAVDRPAVKQNPRVSRALHKARLAAAKASKAILGAELYDFSNEEVEEEEDLELDAEKRGQGLRHKHKQSQNTTLSDGPSDDDGQSDSESSTSSTSSEDDGNLDGDADNVYVTRAGTAVTAAEEAVRHARAAAAEQDRERDAALDSLAAAAGTVARAAVAADRAREARVGGWLELEQEAQHVQTLVESALNGVRAGDPSALDAAQEAADRAAAVGRRGREAEHRVEEAIAAREAGRRAAEDAKKRAMEAREAAAAAEAPLREEALSLLRSARAALSEAKSAYVEGNFGDENIDQQTLGSEAGIAKKLNSSSSSSFDGSVVGPEDVSAAIAAAEDATREAAAAAKDETMAPVLARARAVGAAARANAARAAAQELRDRVQAAERRSARRQRLGRKLESLEKRAEIAWKDAGAAEKKAYEALSFPMQSNRWDAQGRQDENAPLVIDLESLDFSPDQYTSWSPSKQPSKKPLEPGRPQWHAPFARAEAGALSATASDSDGAAQNQRKSDAENGIPEGEASASARLAIRAVQSAKAALPKAVDEATERELETLVARATSAVSAAEDAAATAARDAERASRTVARQRRRRDRSQAASAALHNARVILRATAAAFRSSQATGALLLPSGPERAIERAEDALTSAEDREFLESQDDLVAEDDEDDFEAGGDSTTKTENLSVKTPRSSKQERKTDGSDTSEESTSDSEEAALDQALHAEAEAQRAAAALRAEQARSAVVRLSARGREPIFAQALEQLEPELTARMAAPYRSMRRRAPPLPSQVRSALRRLGGATVARLDTVVALAMAEDGEESARPRPATPPRKTALLAVPRMERLAFGKDPGTASPSRTLAVPPVTPAAAKLAALRKEALDAAETRAAVEFRATDRSADNSPEWSRSMPAWRTLSSPAAALESDVAARTALALFAATETPSGTALLRRVDRERAEADELPGGEQSFAKARLEQTLASTAASNTTAPPTTAEMHAASRRATLGALPSMGSFLQKAPPPNTSNSTTTKKQPQSTSRRATTISVAQPPTRPQQPNEPSSSRRSIVTQNPTPSSHDVRLHLPSERFSSPASASTASPPPQPRQTGAPTPSQPPTSDRRVTIAIASSVQQQPPQQQAPDAPRLIYPSQRAAERQQNSARVPTAAPSEAIPPARKPSLRKRSKKATSSQLARAIKSVGGIEDPGRDTFEARRRASLHVAAPRLAQRSQSATKQPPGAKRRLPKK